ncbi:MAG: type II secretory pathway component GspD/PulD (secretin) [Planctomycetota bacterium]|jgi:type II secretory pathway component GspD/PulD (secretin)
MRLPILIITAFSFAGCQALESNVGVFHPDLLQAMTQSPIHMPVFETDEPGTVAPGLHSPEETWPSMGGDELITLNLRGTPLQDALNMLAEQAGVNFLLEGELLTPVHVSFPSVRVDDAIRSLLEKNDMRLIQDNAGIFSVQTRSAESHVTEAIFLQSVPAADVAEQLQALAGSANRVVIDEGRNVIMLDGNRATLEAIQTYLSAVDRLKPQVLLEVTIFEAILGDQFELGLRHSYSDKWNDAAYNVATTLSGSPGAFSLTLADQDGNPNLAITALRRYVGLELVSAPRVIAVTQEEASVEVIEEIPYVETTSTTETGDGLGSNVTEQVAYKESGIKLKVTPTIQEAGILQVKIDLVLSEIVDTFKDIPILDSRKMASTFLVNDGETIVLGGLMQDRRRDEESGVPGLMNIPGIGRFFRNDNDSNDRRELLVFVTPRILSPGQAAQLSKHYQDRYRESRKAISKELSSGGPGQAE